MSAMPCEVKITQVNESKIPCLGMDVVELAPRGERTSGTGCVTEGRLESGKGSTKWKKEGQEPERVSLDRTLSSLI